MSGKISTPSSDQSPNSEVQGTAASLDGTVRIRSVLERYFHGLDARDVDELASCFSPDASVAYSGSGADFTLRGGRAIAAHLIQTVTRFTATIHMLANAAIRVEGETAHADSFAIAYVVIPDRVLIRGIRYKDRLVLRSGTWSIVNRLHEPFWQFESATVPPWVPS